MSYRNPRFSFVHTVVTVGDAGYEASTSAFDAADPRTRMADYQAKLNALTTGTGAVAIEFSRDSVSIPAWELNRVIIPSSTMVRDRLVKFALSSIVGGSETTPADVDNAGVLDFWAPDGFFDVFFSGIVMAGPYDAETADVIFLDFEANPVAAAKLGIGELWWTNTFQPTTGIIPAYTDAKQPTHARVTMESGADFTTLLGPPRRRFTLRHEAMEEADRRLYSTMIDYIGAGSTPFWYEHPDSGDAKTVIKALSSTADVSSVLFCTVDTVSSSPDYHTGNVVEATSSVASGFNVTMAVTSGDLRNHVISLDIEEGQNNITDRNHLSLVLNDSRGNSSTFRVGGAMAGGASALNWIRVEADLSTDNDGVGGSGTSGADLSDIAFITVSYNTLNIGETIRLANLTATDKTKRPVLVQLEGVPRWTQASPVPSGGSGALWTLEMAMLESTS